MAIAAIRFETLDQETNVSVADFLSGLDSSILNSPNLKNLTMPLDLKSLIGVDMTDFDVDKLKGIRDQVDSTIRKAKGLLGQMKDLSSITQKDLVNNIAGLFPNTPLGKEAAAAFKTLAQSCVTKGFKAKSINAKPFDFDLSCGGKNKKSKSKNKCSSSGAGISGVFNKLSGGAISSAYSDFNEIANNLTNLGSLGYDANLCGVFTTLTGGLDLPIEVLSRIAGGMLLDIVSKGNVLGLFDLSASTTALDPLKEVPNAIDVLMENYQQPIDVMEKDLAQYSENLTGSLELLDEDWNVSEDGLDSVAFTDNFNSDVSDAFMSKEINDTDLSDAFDMDVPVETDFTAQACTFSNLSDMTEDFSFDFW